DPAIRAGAKPRVADHDHAAVAEVADQPTDALLQREHGLGQLRFDERIAAGAANRIETRLHERVARHGERQLVDRDEPQRTPRHVYALPEAPGAEQHGVARFAEPLEKLMPRPAAL